MAGICFISSQFNIKALSLKRIVSDDKLSYRSSANYFYLTQSDRS